MVRVALYMIISTIMGLALTSQDIEKQNLEIVKKAVEGINKSLPQSVDKFTQLVLVKSKGAKLIYYFDVNSSNNDQKMIEYGKKIEPRVKKGICKSSKRFLKSGIDITYIYKNSSSNKEVLKVEVTSKDCKLLW